MTIINQETSEGARTSTYGKIISSSSILGFSQVLIYVISILRMKVAALLLGPSGVGMLGLYQSVITLVATVSSLGVGNSGVRDIAEAAGQGDEERVRRTSGILHKFALGTGLLGWLLAAALSYPLSQWTFNETNKAGSIAILGVCVFLGSVGTSYAAVLQGTRRIKTLAKFQIATTGISALASVILFYFFRAAAIVPSLIAAAFVNCALILLIRRRHALPYEKVSWTETLLGSRQLVAMGIAFMWNAVSTSLVALATRSILVRYDSLEANGIYQASWAISGMFAGFILQAMGTDFYPRLTSAADDPKEMEQMINEQTEIGVLLAGPGVLFTLCLAPFLMEYLYSSKFISGAPMICWFAIGVFGQVVSWPLGFVQIARGASRSFIITQTLFNGLHFGLVAIFFWWLGLIGIGIAYPVLYLTYTIAMLAYAKSDIGFSWSRGVIKLISVLGVLAAAGFMLALSSHGPVTISAGILLAVAGSFFCRHELLQRLPDNHRIGRLLRLRGLF